eukprot:GAHX01001642.1.p1 GENE.GAHX01001642.1~~GAHX01001642.1.p1  ORF type:complete len:239 (+),score=28.80 GAHX01001642.1:3331-4047(+)
MIKHMEKTTSKEVIGALQEWIAKHGKPNSVLTDNGRQYTSKEYEKFLKREGIRSNHSTPYNPRGNSVSERLNQSVGNILRINRGSLVSDVIPLIEAELNFTVHSTHGYISEKIIKGYSAIDPLQRKQNVDIKELKQAIQEKAFSKKGDYSNRLPKPFEISETVYAMNFEMNKMDPHWVGPLKITRQEKSPKAVYVGMSNGQNLHSRRNLKRWKCDGTYYTGNRELGIGKMDQIVTNSD